MPLEWKVVVRSEGERTDRSSCLKAVVMMAGMSVTEVREFGVTPREVQKWR